MTTMPVFVILLIIAAFAIRAKKVGLGWAILCVLLGVSLAATALGPPLMNGFTALLDGAVSAISGLA